MVFLRLCQEDKEGTPDLVEPSNKVELYCSYSQDFPTERKWRIHNSTTEKNQETLKLRTF